MESGYVNRFPNNQRFPQDQLHFEACLLQMFFWLHENQNQEHSYRVVFCEGHHNKLLSLFSGEVCIFQQKETWSYMVLDVSLRYRKMIFPTSVGIESSTSLSVFFWRSFKQE